MRIIREDDNLAKDLYDTLLRKGLLENSPVAVPALKDAPASAEGAPSAGPGSSSFVMASKQALSGSQDVLFDDESPVLSPHSKKRHPRAPIAGIASPLCLLGLFQGPPAPAKKKREKLGIESHALSQSNLLFTTGSHEVPPQPPWQHRSQLANLS